MCEYGFTEDDYSEVIVKNDENSKGGRPATDYEISMDMAKQICMIQRTPEGKKVRQYLIDLEKAWNTPELVMARGLQASKVLLEQKEEKIKQLTADNERMKPKEIFADAVSASDTSILIRDLAKIIKQNGVALGEKRFYKWLREHGYIIKGTCQPTQKGWQFSFAMTTRVTGKGQQYFINKFLGGAK